MIDGRGYKRHIDKECKKEHKAGTAASAETAGEVDNEAGNF